MSKQDFKKFAAELISPSELFEPHRERNRATVQESIELLGSLATLTRSSLVTEISKATGLTPRELAANSPLAPSVQYRTSRSEYQLALKDQRIAQALAGLQSHRENSRENRSKSRAVIRPGQEPFNPVPVPSVNAVVKETRLTSSLRRPSECQPILRENDPSSY